jgi:hypothetical protein
MTQTDLLTARECADYRRCSLRTLDRERERGVFLFWVALLQHMFDVKYFGVK